MLDNKSNEKVTNENIKSLLRCVRNLFLLGLLFTLISFILMCIVYTIDLNYDSETFLDSKVTLQKEEAYLKLDESKSSKLDNYTDALMILTACYSPESGDGAIKEAMANRRLQANGKNPFQTLNTNFKKDNLVVKEYSRYWHGYLVVLKPLLSKLNYSQIRKVNTFVQGGLLFVLITTYAVEVLPLTVLAVTLVIPSDLPVITPCSLTDARFPFSILQVTF